MALVEKALIPTKLLCDLPGGGADDIGRELHEGGGCGDGGVVAWGVVGSDCGPVLSSPPLLVVGAGAGSVISTAGVATSIELVIAVPPEEGGRNMSSLSVTSS